MLLTFVNNPEIVANESEWYKHICETHKDKIYVKK